MLALREGEAGISAQEVAMARKVGKMLADWRRRGYISELHKSSHAVLVSALFTI